MVTGKGNDIADRLMQLQGNCPKCGTTLTFKQAAMLAKDSGIKEDAVMCHNCHMAYTVNLSLSEMTFVDEIRTDVGEVAQNTLIKGEKVYSSESKDMNNESVIQSYTKQASVNGNDNNNQQAEDDSFFAIFFYKRDAKTGEIRISKTKTISIVFFLFTFIFFLVALLIDPMVSKDPAASVVGIMILFVFALLLTAPVFIVGYVISYVLDREAEKNKQKPSNQQLNNQHYQQNMVDFPIENKNISQKQDNSQIEIKRVQQYYERDNMGTRHDMVEKANAYWLGERFQMETKPPFTLYTFTSGSDAEKALLELPYIHKATDSGNLICDEVYIFGCYKVGEGNYEAIVCGKDLSYDDFLKAEEAFKKHGGTLKNNLEPEKSIRKSENKKENNKVSSLKFREKITQNQFTYECYDADTKQEALDFLKNRSVNERLYYVCVYTPEGNYGRDIDGIYQM